MKFDRMRQMRQPRLTDIPEPFLFLYISEPCYNCEKALSASQHWVLCCKANKNRQNTHQIWEKLLIRKFEKDRNPRGISYYSYQFYCKMDLSAMAEDDNNLTAQTAFCVTHNRKIVGFHFLLVKVLRLLLLRLWGHELSSRLRYFLLGPCHEAPS